MIGKSLERKTGIIFTGINEILEIIDKSQEKKIISGYAFKITHIAAARCPNLQSSALN